MSFLNPLFLFALLSVGIPLLIYLLNIRKPRKISFSTLAFFEALKSTALKKIKIKRWLLLAIRALAIIMLVMAASRPFLPPNFGWSDQSQPKVISILIDNSPSMDRINQNGPFIEQAKELAENIVDMAEGETRFSVNITNGESLNTPLLSPPAANRRIGEIVSVNAGNYLAERVRAETQALMDADEPNKVLYLITDGQSSQLEQLRNNLDIENSDIYVQAIMLGTARVPNLSFSNVQLENNPAEIDGDRQLRITVENLSEQSVTNAFLSMSISGELITQQSIGLSAGGTFEEVLSVPDTGEDTIPVELTLEGDGQTFDNTYYAAIRQPENKQVLVIHENRSGSGFQSYLQPLLNAASQSQDVFQADFIEIDDVSVSEFDEYDAIILDGLRTIPDYITQPLIDHVQTGAGLLFLPAAEGSINSYNRFLSFAGTGSYTDVIGSYGSFDPIDRIDEPNDGHPMLDAVFETNENEEIRLNSPELFYYFQIEMGSNEIAVLQNRLGSPMFVESRLGTGKMVYSAIGGDPGWSNFPVKPFYAPFFYRMINYLMQGSGAELLTHTLGQEFSAAFAGETQSVRLVKGGEEIIPRVSRTFQGPVLSYSGTEWTPGWLMIENGLKNTVIGVNQNAMESAPQTLSSSEFSALIESTFENSNVLDVDLSGSGNETELQNATFGREIWYWFILLAFTLLIAESLVSRHYKAEIIE
jgi:hypothetical protein